RSLYWYGLHRDERASGTTHRAAARRSCHGLGGAPTATPAEVCPSSCTRSASPLGGALQEGRSPTDMSDISAIAPHPLASIATVATLARGEPRERSYATVN